MNKRNKKRNQNIPKDNDINRRRHERKRKRYNRDDAKREIREVIEVERQMNESFSW